MVKFLFLQPNLVSEMISSIHKYSLVFLLFCFISCQKEIGALHSLQPDSNPADTDSRVKEDTAFFVTYTILQGQQYCVGNTYPPYVTSALHFIVKFDSSAIYTSQVANNQYDYNKLYGFSDNKSDHHSFSARFGWRWCHNQVELSTYTYNDGIRSIVDLGGIDLNEEHNCAIVVSGNRYNFVLDGDTTLVPRTSQTQQAIGYKLYPYFGGDETAPHNVNIRIKEMK